MRDGREKDNKALSVIAIPTECREKPVRRQTGFLIILLYYSYKEIAAVVNSPAEQKQNL